MAEQIKKNKRPSVGFYGEPGFVSLSSSLRKISGDDTIPTDNYVDVYKDLYDLITPDNNTQVKFGVLDVTLTSDKHKLVIHYSDSTTKTIELEEENYLYQVYYDKFGKKLYFVLKNGEKINLDLEFLFELFATKEELKEEVEKAKEESKIYVDNRFEEGIINVKWLSF